MADIDDAWYRLDKVTGEIVPTDRHGRGKRWLARWSDGARQRKKSFAKRNDAKRFLAQVQVDLDRGSYVDPRAARARLRDFAEGWLASQTTDPSTREAVALRLRLHVLPQLGDYQLGGCAPASSRSGHEAYRLGSHRPMCGSSSPTCRRCCAPQSTTG